jgi:hypothetical protein
MILKLLDFQQLFKIKLAFILTYPIDFITCTGLQGLPAICTRFNPDNSPFKVFFTHCQKAVLE